MLTLGYRDYRSHIQSSNAYFCRCILDFWRHIVMTSIVLRRWCKSVDPSDTDSKFRGFTSCLWPLNVISLYKSQVVFVRPASTHPCCSSIGTSHLANQTRSKEGGSTVARLQVARLRWLSRQANLPLLGGRRRLWQMCHWPWSVKSTIRKGRPSQTQHKTGLHSKNCWLPTTTTACDKHLWCCLMDGSQAKLPLQDGWRRTWQMCQWPWNLKSTIS